MTCFTFAIQEGSVALSFDRCVIKLTINVSIFSIVGGSVVSKKIKKIF